MTSSSISALPAPDPYHEGFLPLLPSPILEPHIPVTPTDDLGMIVDGECPPEETATKSVVRAVKKRKPARPRRKVTYISRHFSTVKAKDGEPEDAVKKENREITVEAECENGMDQGRSVSGMAQTTPQNSRIYYGLNVDELSSDSDLTDVPDDIGPDPFESRPQSNSNPTKVRIVKVKKSSQKSRVPTTSPFFPSPHRHRSTFLSTLPFPPLSHERFGLMQERLAHGPFRLLIATIFLNKTPGERAMPVFYDLMSRYPTPADLASAEVGDITSLIYGLGFQNQRARKCVAMAKAWVERPPEPGKRYRKQNYPLKGDGRDVGSEEVLGENDKRVAWEISHLPGLGPYSHDSWRIFCRDELRGLAKAWNGEGAANPDEFEPEWKRVIPLDKELRAWLTWMWLKEGWVWNKETGVRTKANDDLMAMAQGGGIVVEEKDSEHLTVKATNEDGEISLRPRIKVDRAAGEFLPEVADAEDTQSHSRAPPTS